MYQKKTEKIQEVISAYFEGIYTGNTEKAQASFHPQTLLYGDVKGNEYFKSLEDYLHGVRNRKSPAALNEANNMEIISIEVLGDVAVAKLHMPILGYNYFDYASLAVVDGEWKIVNIVFTHVE